MHHDPLRHAIAEAIDRGIDGNAFDASAWELLSPVYPNLAPVRGGGDAGFDGAFSSAAGRYPLICTVSDVGRNVRKNLKAYLKTGGPKRAVVATCRKLTPPQQRKIIDAAKTLGVTIEQIHEREWLISALVASPLHRLRLTGIPGDPEALSPLAEGSRQRVTELLIGRADDLKWLRDQPGDALLVGQPGSGKTALHAQLAAEGMCLFVRDFNLGRLRDAILKNRPRCIVVDDAHLEPRMLATIVAFRRDIVGSFSIHANCWPSERNECRVALGINEDQVRELQPLTRDEIVQVVKAAGVEGPDMLLHTILAQAIGRPGLAVMLAKACLAKEGDRVWTGEVLAAFLLDGRGMGTSSSEQGLLGVLSLSGEWGLKIEDVAKCLGESVLDVRKRLARLAAGGVLEDMGPGRVRVQPMSLRFLLVKRVFFESPGTLDVRRFIGIVRPDDLVHALLGARQRKAAVGLGFLRQALSGCGSTEAFEHLAHTDQECCRLLLDEYPNQVVSGASGLLHFEPERALIALFSRCATSADPKGGGGRIQEALQGWITDEYTNSAEVVGRKKLIADTFATWCRAAGATQLRGTGWVLAEILSLGFAFSKEKPGSGSEYVFSHGTYPEPVARGVMTIWPTLRASLAVLPKSEWKPLLHEVSQWGRSLRRILPEGAKFEDFLRDSRRQMVVDIATNEAANRAVRLWASTYLRDADAASIDIANDVDYNDLFTSRRLNEDWRDGDERIAETQRQLARRLATRPAQETAARVLEMETEDAALGVDHHHHRWVFYSEVATLTDSPVEWATTLIAARADLMHTWPFIHRLIEDKHPAALGILRSCFTVPQYRASAALTAILLEPREPELFDLVIASTDGTALPDGFALARAALSEIQRHELLTCPNRRIRSAAAVAEMIRAEQAPIPSLLVPAWATALLDCDDNHTAFWLERMSASVPDSAFKWLRQRTADIDAIGLMDLSHCVSPLLPLLSLDQRAELLALIAGKSMFIEEMFEAVLAKDMALFEKWYSTCSDESTRAEAIASGYPDSWAPRMEIALRYNPTADVLRSACSPGGVGGVGRMSEAYERIAEFFERFKNHPHAGLRTAIAEHTAWVRRRVDDLRRQERHRAVTGRD